MNGPRAEARTLSTHEWSYDQEQHFEASVQQVSYLGDVSDQNRDMELEVKSSVNVLADITASETRAQILRRFEKWKDIWLTMHENPIERYRYLRRLFHADNDSVVLEQKGLRETFDKYMGALLNLKFVMTGLGLYNPNSEIADIKKRVQDFSKVMEIIVVAHDTHVNLVRNEVLANPLVAQFVPSYQGMNPYAPSEAKQTEQQVAMAFLLQFTKRYNLRKRGDRVYEQILTSNGFPTHAWRDTEDIEALVYRAPEPKEANPVFYHCITKGNNYQVCARHLARQPTGAFPFVKIDRNMFSFENGIFVTVDAKFYPWGNRAILSDWTTSNYFPVRFELEQYEAIIQAQKEQKEQKEEKMEGDDNFRYEPWMYLPTTAIDDIFESQRFPRAIRQARYMFLGKLLFYMRQPVNSRGDKEGWQIISLAKGMAGTGKSTLLRIPEYCYPAGHVGVFGDIVERNFPLESVLDSFVWLAPDVSDHWNFPQTLWQSIVTGESVRAARKFKTAINVFWNIPGDQAMNNWPPFTDNAGSFSRRSAVHIYNYPPLRADPMLFDKIKASIAILLYKMTLAFIHYVSKYGSTDFWIWTAQDYKYYHDQRRLISQETNALEAFLHSSECRLGAGLYVPFNRFVEAFKAYCESTGFYNVPKFTSDYYTPSFNLHNILYDSTQQTSLIYPIGSETMLTTNFIRRVGLVQQQQPGRGQQQQGQQQAGQQRSGWARSGAGFVRT